MESKGYFLATGWRLVSSRNLFSVSPLICLSLGFWANQVDHEAKTVFEIMSIMFSYTAFQPA